MQGKGRIHDRVYLHFVHLLFSNVTRPPISLPYLGALTAKVWIVLLINWFLLTPFTDIKYRYFNYFLVSDNMKKKLHIFYNNKLGNILNYLTVIFWPNFLFPKIEIFSRFKCHCAPCKFSVHLFGPSLTQVQWTSDIDREREDVMDLRVHIRIEREREDGTGYIVFTIADFFRQLEPSQSKIYLINLLATLYSSTLCISVCLRTYKMQNNSNYL